MQAEVFNWMQDSLRLSLCLVDRDHTLSIVSVRSVRSDNR